MNLKKVSNTISEEDGVDKDEPRYTPYIEQTSFFHFNGSVISSRQEILFNDMR